MVKLNQPNIDYIKFSLKPLYSITISDELAIGFCIKKNIFYAGSAKVYPVASGFELTYGYFKGPIIAKKHVRIFRHSIYFQKLIKCVHEDLKYYETNINE